MIPAGILRSIFFSRVGIVYVLPSSASVSFTFKLIRISFPLRTKSLCGRTCIFIYKSPAVPPCTASPFPVSRIISPLSIPAGIVSLISSCFCRTPLPLQFLQGVFGIFPIPLHSLHSRALVKVPNIERRVSCTEPLPLQVPHIFTSFLSFAPVPSHSLQ